MIVCGSSQQLLAATWAHCTKYRSQSESSWTAAIDTRLLETFRILAFPFILAQGVSRNRIAPHSLIDRQVFVAGARPPRPLALLPLLSPTIFSRFVWLELVTDKKSITRTLGPALFLYWLKFSYLVL
ncbi:hypothetical protein I7I51_08333 [Histoplasma capsulatum]|uniref:Uncharacterized protein n=1 Tax=Ajellomyces capsulatus TaxID=5037 RepID=A0A8A1M2B7_AJECA|nr:hypothetical protein I7I51_08333 [Histoplasma capsulatum]